VKRYIPAPLLWAILITSVLGVSWSLGLSAQQARPAAPATDLPTSYICLHHPEIFEVEPGTCPICKMKLVPIKLDSIWSCPVHSVIARHDAGKCPICRRDLVQVSVARSWTCPGRSDIDELDPGKCPDGSAMVVKYSPRPHGNHNAQHGGLFFMAPDNWHHVEGAYPQSGRFVMYVYDDYAKPLSAAKMNQVKARVVTKETFDSQTKTTKEIAAFPLTLSKSGTHFEAKIDPVAPPANMTAKVAVQPGGPEYRFDFSFPEFSKEPVVPVSPSPSPSAGGTTAPRGEAASGEAGQASAARREEAKAKLAQLHVQTGEVNRLLETGAFLEMYVPALAAKEVALDLESFTNDVVPSQQRQNATSAIQRLVASAWLLDMYGDQGDRQKLAEAYTVFASAVKQIDEIFSK